LNVAYIKKELKKALAALKQIEQYYTFYRFSRNKNVLSNQNEVDRNALWPTGSSPLGGYQGHRGPSIVVGIPRMTKRAMLIASTPTSNEVKMMRWVVYAQDESRRNI
jgi:hypothetical protein